MRRIFRRLATARLTQMVFHGVGGNTGMIFMFHRFRDDERGVPGHDPEFVRQALTRLKDAGFRFVPLMEIVEAIEVGTPLPPRTLAFTIDDGYWEQAHVAGPLFHDMDCPVTVFVVSEYVDGIAWAWWDQVEYLLDNAPSAGIAGEWAGMSLRWQSQADRLQVKDGLLERLKGLPHVEARRLIVDLAAAGDVKLPARAPDRFRFMTWDDARMAARWGVTIGPHSVSHRILSRASDEQADAEIRESWRRVAEEVPGAVPVFCYPNGLDGDYGERECRVVREAGMRAAVTVGRDVVDTVRLSGSPMNRHRIPRFEFPTDDDELKDVLSGYVSIRAVPRRWTKRCREFIG